MERIGCGRTYIQSPSLKDVLGFGGLLESVYSGLMSLSALMARLTGTVKSRVFIAVVVDGGGRRARVASGGGGDNGICYI